MTSLTIPANETSVTTTLGLGTYNVTATASSMITITEQRTITQANIDSGAATWDLGTMEEGEHSFNVALPEFTEGNFAVGDIAKVTLLLGSNVVDSKQFEVKGSGSDLAWYVKGTSELAEQAVFTVSPTDHVQGDEFVLKAEVTNRRPATTNVTATPGEYTAAGSESVTMPLGTIGLTLTVVVTNAYGPTSVSVVKV